MPTVRILAGLAGTSDQPGQELHVSGALAQQLIAEGRAELVREQRAETPERAVVEKTRRKTG